VAALAGVQSEWVAIGYHWRALEAAQDIQTISAAQAAAAEPAFKTPALPRHGDDPQMTEEQRRLMRLVLEGRSRKEIATHLNLSINTVRNYLSVLYRLFQVSTRSELIVRCFKDERVLESIAR
jgi:DNA-binding NarL/FixJ family response regulator